VIKLDRSRPQPHWPNVRQKAPAGSRGGHSERSNLGASDAPDLPSSTSVRRRNLPDNWRNAIDANGTLPNGNQWRHASLCGEALEYYDVPAEVANYFDRVIDGAYFRISIR